MISTPHDEVRRLVAHRLKREEKVLRAVASASGRTLEELVAVVYDDTQNLFASRANDAQLKDVAT